MASSQESGSEEDSNLKELIEGLHFLNDMKNPDPEFSDVLHHIFMVENKIEEKPGTFDFIQGNLLERRKQKKYGFDYMRKGLKRLKQQRDDLASFFEDSEGNIRENWRKNEDPPSNHFKVDDHMSAIKQTSSEEEQQKGVICNAQLAFHSWCSAQMEAAEKKHIGILSLKKSILEDHFTITQEEGNVLTRLECACRSFIEHHVERYSIHQIHEFLKLQYLELDKCIELLQVCIQSRIYGSNARSLAEIIKVGKVLNEICTTSNLGLRDTSCLKRIVYQVNLLKKIKAATYILKNIVDTMEKARPLIEMFF
ncbi:uncharacterized protein [Panulirus ornatus]|uniref:uncharacterized protein isoform X2 n=1 Tax=Panulirus ornatus TaxID=150431 RepID=UPI003A85E273